MRWMIVAAALPLLAACASLSEEECRAADWRGIGFADGAAGRTADYIQRHREACADVGVSPDLSAWLAGREDGLKRYCTAANAYSVGRQGRTLSPVCPAAEARSLRAAFDRGRRYYRAGQEIRTNEQEIRSLQNTLSDLPSDSTERASLQRQIAQLRTSILRLRAEQALYAGGP